VLIYIINIIVSWTVYQLSNLISRVVTKAFYARCVPWNYINIILVRYIEYIFDFNLISHVISARGSQRYLDIHIISIQIFQSHVEEFTRTSNYLVSHYLDSRVKVYLSELGSSFI